MKFFTPRIYQDINSADRAKVGEAHEKWERAIEAYDRHLKTIGRKLPSRVRELASSLCLHDAEFEDCVFTKVGRQPFATVIVRQAGDIVLLFYALARKPVTTRPRDRWPFSKKQVIWLYDEFDVDADGTPQHEILLSDGRVLTLRFSDLRMVKKPLPEKIAV